MGETVAPPKITLGGDGLRFLPPSARLWYCPSPFPSFENSEFLFLVQMSVALFPVSIESFPLYISTYIYSHFYFLAYHVTGKWTNQRAGENLDQ